MKLIVSTFLVYKVKKCLLKSGKVTFCYFKSRNRIKQGCPSLGHRVPTLWASVAQGLSIVSPSLGPSLFVFSSSTYCSFLYLVDYIWRMNVSSMKTKSSPLWRLKVVLYEGWNSIQMTGDEGWWRVIFYPSSPEPQCLSGFQAKRWRVKDKCLYELKKVIKIGKKNLPMAHSRKCFIKIIIRINIYIEELHHLLLLEFKFRTYIKK